MDRQPVEHLVKQLDKLTDRLGKIRQSEDDVTDELDELVADFLFLIDDDTRKSK